MSFIQVADGARIRYHDRGYGPVIVLIHGWKMSHRAWDKAALHLAKNFRVISYDLRGMGESEKQGSKQYFEQHVDDLFFMLDKLGVKEATLVGWSMGCSVVLSSLDVKEDRVKRAVLINGPVKLINSEDFHLGINQEYLDRVVERMIDRWPEGERAWVKDTFCAEYPEHVNWFTQIALQTPLEIAVSMVRQQSLKDLRSVVENANVPILALYGRHDPYYSVALGEWIAARAKNGKSVIFEESAHCPPIEETDKFVRTLVDFCKNE